ncbi:MAG: ATP-binding protein [Prolixibacteraceae bacterium]
MKRINIESPGESYSKVLSLIDHLPAGVVVHAPDTSILYSNAEASRLLGLSKEQLQGKVAIDPSWCFLREDGTPIPIEKYPVNQAITTLQPLINFEAGIRELESGNIVWVLVNAIPEFNKKNELYQVAVTFVDITLRKQAENEMKVLSEIIEGLIQTKDLGDLLKLIHNCLKKVLYAENCFFALYDAETDLFNFPYFVDEYDQTPSPQRMDKSCSRFVFKTGKSELITPERFQELKDLGEIELIGSPSPSWIGVPLQTSAGIIGVMVLQHYTKANLYKSRQLTFLDSIASQVSNVIERKRTEEELERSYKLVAATLESLKKKEANLRELNITKDKFFSIITHDLKSPFNGILGFSNILTEQISNKDYDGIQEYGAIIHQSSQKAMNLLTNLIEWSRSQSGRMDFNPEYCEISSLLNEIFEVSNVSALEKSIRLTKEVPRHVSVVLDKEMISSVIRNLISNAIKFTRPGGEVVVRAESIGRELQIFVRDNGVGIDRLYLDKLFRIDEAYSALGTNKESGTGLGLLLCKEFVEKHKGRIWVESELDKGSTFYFTIPNN